MEIVGHKKYQVMGNPKSLDKTINQAYIDAIKRHIELLEDKKRIFEREFIDTQTPNLVKGIIQGMNYAIEQLYDDINQLKDK